LIVAANNPIRPRWRMFEKMCVESKRWRLGVDFEHINELFGDCGEEFLARPFSLRSLRIVNSVRKLT